MPELNRGDAKWQIGRNGKVAETYEVGQGTLVSLHCPLLPNRESGVETATPVSPCLIGTLLLHFHTIYHVMNTVGFIFFLIVIQLRFYFQSSFVLKPTLFCHDRRIYVVRKIE